MAIKIKNILITGATGTLGSAIAKAIARGPNRFIALHCHRKTEKAHTLATELEKMGASTCVLTADLSKPGEAVKLATYAFDKLGGMDLFVHSASIFEHTPLGTVTDEQWDRIISIDLKAAFFLAQEVGMRMKKCGGKMVFLSDVAALRPYTGYLPYCIAKAGLDALVRGLAKSLAPKVLVNAVAPYVVTRPPGITDRAWNDLLSNMPTMKAQTPEEIAALIRMLAEEGESITGQVIAVDGGRMVK